MPHSGIATEAGAILFSGVQSAAPAPPTRKTARVTYTYNSDHTLATKTDAKSQVFTFSYDGYKRLTTISVGGNTLSTTWWLLVAQASACERLFQHPAA